MTLIVSFFIQNKKIFPTNMMELDCFEIENRFRYNYRGTQWEILRKKI